MRTKRDEDVDEDKEEEASDSHENEHLSIFLSALILPTGALFPTKLSTMHVFPANTLSLFSG